MTDDVFPCRVMECMKVVQSGGRRGSQQNYGNAISDAQGNAYQGHAKGKGGSKCIWVVTQDGTWCRAFMKASVSQCSNSRAFHSRCSNTQQRFGRVRPDWPYFLQCLDQQGVRFTAGGCGGEGGGGETLAGGGHRQHNATGRWPGPCPTWPAP